MNHIVSQVTQAIIERSQQSRADYLLQIQTMKNFGVARKSLSCGNLAHGFAANTQEEKKSLSQYEKPNIGILSSYNDMLSAHQPYQDYPAQIKAAAMKKGITVQFAGGVPAMCDGVTQGQPGMELSLFSRDSIAMSSAIALSHNMFDAVVCLGICDKIVPGMLIGALRFGHLPTVFIPAGPMASGMSNGEKSRIRKAFQLGEVDRDELLRAESESYHSAGTCTFYGTANSNQMLMEMMGLQLPSSSFVNPGTPLRSALTEGATNILCDTLNGIESMGIGEMINEKSIVNAMIGLMATGGSTNHTIHLIAIARAAGIIINWDDFSLLSSTIPLLARVYPNGDADVNHFHAAGGMNLIIWRLLNDGLLHDDVNTIVGPGMRRYCKEAYLNEEQLDWRDGIQVSLDSNVIAAPDCVFSKEGGIRVLKGNLGSSVIKTSAVDVSRQVIMAPAKVFEEQSQLQAAFDAGELTDNFIAVVRYQGPKSNGMPELHKLTPILSVLQDKGLSVALVTDGRMSGASGSVPAAIHLTPEALDGGLIAKVKDGDILSLDCHKGELSLLVSDDELLQRNIMPPDLSPHHVGMGRELFSMMREKVGSAEIGASVFDF
ncbi:phosphogluconate dehydratase [Pseudomonas sp. HK3]|jgi:phosphogluconate dehydratase